ncbi:hypothetical protein H5410_052304 [Solanum commersonii]|uniref:Uncharacterized protein n=1 Tax=Solanum commersonii TaxID=4109 RepID=A0A9J5X2M3_SOLCO|nr:hypothetical protein H5410_052304 [Solanum commersonii]
MIIPEDIEQQPEIPSLYANKRIIGISTIIQEIANNYLNGNTIWSYYARDQLMIYSNSRELRKVDMDEVQKWILSLIKTEERSTTRALKVGFILAELLTRYCKLIGHKYPDHICSKCNVEVNIIPNVQLRGELAGHAPLVHDDRLDRILGLLERLAQGAAGIPAGFWWGREPEPRLSASDSSSSRASGLATTRFGLQVVGVRPRDGLGMMTESSREGASFQTIVSAAKEAELLERDDFGGPKRVYTGGQYSGTS